MFNGTNTPNLCYKAKFSLGSLIRSSALYAEKNPGQQQQIVKHDPEFAGTF